MPYNILHVIPYMHPSAGGPPVVVENFVREANELGHRSRILSTPGYCDGDERELLKRLEQLAPTTFLSPLETLPGVGRARSGATETWVREADIVHVHTLWSPLNVSARHACARLGRPYVLMPHGMLDPYSLSVKALRKSIYLHMFEKQNITCAARIIYTTPEEERLAKLAGLPLPVGELVPLGANASTASKSQLHTLFVAQFPEVAGKRVLLFLGRVHPKKGLDRILRCIHSLRETVPNLLLVVAGDGDAGYVGEVRRTVGELSLEGNVLFAGRLHGDLKWASFATAELFLLPSRQENFAITVAEAMQMGVPVIVTDKVNTWPYVEEAGAGLVVDERAVDTMLPRAVADILGNDAARARMGAQGASYARERLTWQRAIREMLACYDRVISNGG